MRGKGRLCYDPIGGTIDDDESLNCSWRRSIQRPFQAQMTLSVCCRKPSYVTDKGLSLFKVAVYIHIHGYIHRLKRHKRFAGPKATRADSLLHRTVPWPDSWRRGGPLESMMRCRIYVLLYYPIVHTTCRSRESQSYLC